MDQSDQRLLSLAAARKTQSPLSPCGTLTHPAGESGGPSEHTYTMEGQYNVQFCRDLRRKQLDIKGPE